MLCDKLGDSEKEVPCCGSLEGKIMKTEHKIMPAAQSQDPENDHFMDRKNVRGSCLLSSYKRTGEMRGSGTRKLKSGTPFGACQGGTCTLGAPRTMSSSPKSSECPSSQEGRK